MNQTKFLTYQQYLFHHRHLRTPLCALMNRPPNLIVSTRCFDSLHYIMSPYCWPNDLTGVTPMGELK